jgi:hypothetical protein
MMSHPLVMAVALAGFAIAALAAAVEGPWRSIASGAAGLVGVLALERLVAGISAAWRFRTLTPLVFPALHLARDLAWVAAIVIWTIRRMSGRPATPAHSMRPRPEIAP